MASSSPGRTAGFGIIGILGIGVIALAGCGGRSDHHASGLFDDQNQAAINCMTHQKQQPGPLYTGGQNADTAHILQMMQYYTSAGDKPYCDAKSASTIDTTWGRLYVSLGGQPAKVTTVLGRP